MSLGPQRVRWWEMRAPEVGCAVSRGVCGGSMEEKYVGWGVEGGVWRAKRAPAEGAH